MEKRSVILARQILCTLVLLVVSACSFYSAEPSVVVPDELDHEYVHKVPGKFALHIYGDAYRKDFQLSSDHCYDKNYPLDAVQSFVDSVYQTMLPLMNEIVYVNEPLSRTELDASDFTAQIIIRADDVQASLVEVPGHWDSTVDINVEMVASIEVMPREAESYNRSFTAKFGKLAEGSGWCINVAHRLMEVSEVAMKDLMTQMGQAVTNSRSLRGM
jgi:hypothetical protein